MFVVNKCIKIYNVLYLIFDIEYNGCLLLLCIKCDFFVWDNLFLYWFIIYGFVDYKGYMFELNNFELV